MYVYIYIYIYIRALILRTLTKALVFLNQAPILGFRGLRVIGYIGPEVPMPPKQTHLKVFCKRYKGSTRDRLRVLWSMKRLQTTPGLQRGIPVA